MCTCNKEKSKNLLHPLPHSILFLGNHQYRPQKYIHTYLKISKKAYKYSETLTQFTQFFRYQIEEALLCGRVVRRLDSKTIGWQEGRKACKLWQAVAASEVAAKVLRQVHTRVPSRYMPQANVRPTRATAARPSTSRILASIYSNTVCCTESKRRGRKEFNTRIPD